MTASSVAVTYADYLTRIREKDPSVFLGSLVWYAVADKVQIPHATLQKMIDDLPPEVGSRIWIAPVPEDDNVFRRVSSKHQRKNVETDDPEVFENYLVRDVVRSRGRVVKCIVVEQVDKRGEALSHAEAVRIEFDQGVVTITPLEPDYDQAENVAELIRRDFLAARGTLDSFAVRETFRQTVIGDGRKSSGAGKVPSCNAVVVRPSGGVYFVMERYRDVLNGLIAIAQQIEGADFTAVPLLNDGDMQEMLRTAIDVETHQTIQHTLDDIDKMLDGPEISAAKYQALYRDMVAITSRTAEYEELLDDALAGCNLLAGSYKAKMQKLFLHVGDVSTL